MPRASTSASNISIALGEIPITKKSMVIPLSPTRDEHTEYLPLYLAAICAQLRERPTQIHKIDIVFPGKLQRHTLRILDGTLTEAAALEEAVDAQKTWYRDHNEVVEKFRRECKEIGITVNLLDWDQVGFSAPSFDPNLAQITSCVLKEGDPLKCEFDKAVGLAVEKFEKKSKGGSSSRAVADHEQIKSLCEAYVREELAVFLKWARESEYGVIVYPFNQSPFNISLLEALKKEAGCEERLSTLVPVDCSKKPKKAAKKTGTEEQILAIQQQFAALSEMLKNQQEEIQRQKEETKRQQEEIQRQKEETKRHRATESLRSSLLQMLLVIDRRHPDHAALLTLLYEQLAACVSCVCDLQPSRSAHFSLAPAVPLIKIQKVNDKQEATVGGSVEGSLRVVGVLGRSRAHGRRKSYPEQVDSRDQQQQNSTTHHIFPYSPYSP